MPERDIESYGLVDEPRHVEYSFFLADADGIVSFRVGFTEVCGKPVGCLYRLFHVVETKVAGHRNRAGRVEQQFKGVVATTDSHHSMQLAAPYVGRIDVLKEIIAKAALYSGLALGQSLQVNLKRL